MWNICQLQQCYNFLNKISACLRIYERMGEQMSQMRGHMQFFHNPDTSLSARLIRRNRYYKIKILETTELGWLIIFPFTKLNNWMKPSDTPNFWEKNILLYLFDSKEYNSMPLSYTKREHRGRNRINPYFDIEWKSTLS